MALVVQALKQPAGPGWLGRNGHGTQRGFNSTAIAGCGKLSGIVLNPGVHLPNHLRAVPSSGLSKILLFICVALLPHWAGAQPLDIPAPTERAAAAAEASEPHDLYLHNRRIATFRATLLDDAPAERVRLAEAALAATLKAPGPRAVSQTTTGDSVRFEVNGRAVFFLTAADSDAPRPQASLELLARDVMLRLETAVAEAAEVRDPRRLALGLAFSFMATLAAWLLARSIFRLRRRLARRVHAALQTPTGPGTPAALITTYAEHARVASRLLMGAVAWALVLLIVDTWVTFVLH